MHFPKILLAALPIALAACGGGGGGGGGGLTGDALTRVYAPAEAENVSDTVGASLSSGATGFLAQAGLSSATLHAVRIRVSPDFSTAFLEIDGRPVQTLNGTDTGSGPNYDAFGGFYDENASSTAPALVLTNLDTYSQLGYTGTASIGGFGHAGIEAPDGPISTHLRQDGRYTLWLYPNGIGAAFGTGGGNLNLTFDPSGGTVVGSFAGTFNDGSSSDMGGSVSGTLSGSRFTGDFDIETGAYTGTLDLAGTVYGFEGNESAGVMAGMIGTASGSQAMIGTFTTLDD